MGNVYTLCTTCITKTLLSIVSKVFQKKEEFIVSKFLTKLSIYIFHRHACLFPLCLLIFSQLEEDRRLLIGILVEALMLLCFV